jgi:hypothetical protein
MAAFDESCHDSGHVFLPLFDRLRTSSVHRSTSERAVPEGMARPSAFAVFVLMVSSSFTGCCTGRLAAFRPLEWSEAAPSGTVIML